ncbi:YidB family protein [Sulfurovum sp. XTW-4]|uniref:YidB family protein n=1 Tax=Sulfurovum xiamenensis TaxID=3019066 RepID=A0ABT7QP41_9BACT|nr:YidB family protein [Sulfurovum xiamenensis]MDM5262833.1 YidB family protein [Sulfurovum xiamenensis]
MELADLLKTAASMIQNNGDDTTAGLDENHIVNALNTLVGNGAGGLDLVKFVGGLSQNGLGEIVGSWLGNGENKAISMEQITTLLGAENVATFAYDLGLSKESSARALANVIPQVVDLATRGEGTIMDEMLANTGGSNGAMEMLSKMFR